MTTTRQYQTYLHYAQQQEKKRMGYPLTGSVNGFFSNQKWMKDENHSKMLDYTSLGIAEHSIAHTLMLNIGDPASSLQDEQQRKSSGIFYPEDVENEIIRILTCHFGSPENSLKGYVTSGGTEANLANIWWLRNALMIRNNTDQIVLFASKQTHYSCKKVCQILNIKLIEIAAYENGQLDLVAFSEILQKYSAHSFVVWLNAGTTIEGAIDDIASVRQILLRNIPVERYAIHLDGAILGITLPLFYPQYRTIFDYVDTLTLSGHKLLATVSACGITLAKKSILEQAFKDKDINIGYVHGIKDITIAGGRSCLPIFQLHLSLITFEIHKNSAHFLKLLHTYLENAKFLVIELTKLIGEQYVHYNPKQFNVIFTLLMSPEKALILKEKYTLMPLPDNKVCVTVFANVDKKLIKEFLTDYEAFYEIPEKKSYLYARL